jgi:hypothetical protein
MLLTENEVNPKRNKEMARSESSRKISKSQKGTTLIGYHGTFKRNFENPFNQILPLASRYFTSEINFKFLEKYNPKTVCIQLRVMKTQKHFVRPYGLRFKCCAG